MKTKKAFTLIELLVVISIIALLVSILMPALNKAKQQAKSTVCLSNLKQWGVIWQMYTDENNDKFPALYMNQTANAGNTPRGSWMYCLKKRYEKNEELLQCPAANKIDPDRSGFGEGGEQIFGGQKYMYSFPINDSQLDENSGMLDYSSYGMNTWCSSEVGSTPSIGRSPSNYWISRTKVKLASEVPVFADCKWRGGGPHFGADDGNAGGPLAYRPYPESQGGPDGWGTQDREMGNFAMDRHGTGINLLFADSSARNVPVMGLWNLKWHKQYQQYRNDGEMETLLNLTNPDFDWITKFPAN